MNIGIWPVSEWLNVNLRSLMHNFGNTVRRKPEVGILSFSLSNVRGTIGISESFMPLNTLEHCIVAIRPDHKHQSRPGFELSIYLWVFEPQPDRMIHRGWQYHLWSLWTLLVGHYYIFLKYRPTLDLNYHFLLAAVKFIISTNNPISLIWPPLHSIFQTPICYKPHFLQY